MNNFARETLYQRMPCAELSAGGYYALLAPEIGSNLLRLRDTRNGIEFFRFNEKYTVEEIKDRSVLFGFPTLYLPNRLGGGILKTSDGEYKLPINEKSLETYIHGFLHQRVHKIASLTADGQRAMAVTEYLYDKKDPFFSHFPLKFKAEIRFVLSSQGLEQFFTLINLSDKMLPVGLGSHTAIQIPFVDGGNAQDVRFYLPAGEELELTDRCLCTGNSSTTDRCTLYRSEELDPTAADINNHMFYAQEDTRCTESFHGVTVEDRRSGKKIRYLTGDEYKFWLIWNHGGNMDFFCPEPMTWMIDAPNLNLPSETTGYREIRPGESFTAYQCFFSEV